MWPFSPFFRESFGRLSGVAKANSLLSLRSLKLTSHLYESPAYKMRLNPALLAILQIAVGAVSADQLATGGVRAEAAETLQIFPGDNLHAALVGLGPGDELIINEGSYTTQAEGGGSFFLSVNWQGTPLAPILVQAADGARPVISGIPSQDVMRISGSHFTLRGLEITGGSHGLKLDRVDHATFEDLVIRDVGDVGISCNRPGGLCDRLVIRRNEIFNTGVDGGTGEGMYFGCNGATCEMVDSLITQNFLHDLGGFQGEGIDIKNGSSGNRIQDNVIIGANAAGVALGGYTNAPGRTHNAIERNFIWSISGTGIRLVGQALVSNNLVVASGESGIRAAPDQGLDPKDLQILHNTVFDAGDACLRGNGWDMDDLSTTVVANNALYCPSASAFRLSGGDGSAIVVGNVGLGAGLVPGIASGVSASGDFVDPGRLDFWPSAASVLLSEGDSAYARADFNATERTQQTLDAGAYQRTAPGNPGWLPRAAFKRLPAGVFGDSFEGR